MLLLLLLWTVVLIPATLVGAAVVARVAPAAGEALDRLVLSAWTGVLLLATALLGVSLLVPVGLAGGVVALAATAVALASRRARAQLASFRAALTPVRIAVGVVAMLACASAAAQEVTWYDTGLYHYQAVRWLAEHGTVPGVALLHGRLGFVSSWLALAAAVDDLAPARLCGFAGGLALLLWTLQFTVAAGRALRREVSLADGFALGFWLLHAPRLFASPHVASLSPDLAVTVGVGFTAWLVLLAPERRLAAVLLAALAVGLKPTALPLLAVCGLLAWRRLVPAALVAAVALAPVVAAGLVTSGCLLYPSAGTCLEVAWGVGAPAAAEIAALVRTWYQWGGASPPEGSWLVAWIAADRERAVLLAVAVASLLVIPWSWAREPRARAVAAMSALGIGLMLAMAPSTRFALGYLLAPPALLLAIHYRPATLAAAAALAAALQIASERWVLGAAFLVAVIAVTVWRRRLVEGVIAVILLDAAALHGRAYQRGRFALHPLAPPPLATPAVVEVRRDELVYLHPGEGDRCGAAPIPCAPAALPAHVALRHPERGAAAGFRRLTP